MILCWLQRVTADQGLSLQDTLCILSLLSSLFHSYLSSLTPNLYGWQLSDPTKSHSELLRMTSLRVVGLGWASLCIPWGVWVGKSLWDRHIGDLYSYFTSRSSTSRSWPCSNSDIAPDRACFDYTITTTAQWDGSALFHTLRASVVGFGFRDSFLLHSFLHVMACLFLSLCIIQMQIHFHCYPSEYYSIDMVQPFSCWVWGALGWALRNNNWQCWCSVDHLDCSG